MNLLLIFVLSFILPIFSKLNIFFSNYNQMSSNLLNISPYKEQFFRVLLDTLRKILLTEEDINNIEIEIKYAQFKYFNPSNIERELHHLDPKSKQIIDSYLQIQTNILGNTLSKLSSQSIVYLNPLGKNLYAISSGFHEHIHKKYYHMQEFLLKLSHQNRINNYRRYQLTEPAPYNIYHELGLIGQNHSFRVLHSNEIRLDIYTKEYAPQHLRGRYSYSSISGWKKVNKEALCDQFDFMLGQRIFRFAINRQLEVDVPLQDLLVIGELLKKPKAIDIRLKNILRVLKGNKSQFSLSEIYNIKDSAMIPQLSQNIIGENSDLNQFLRRVFIGFYSVGDSQFIKFQIQSEFTKTHTQKLRNLIRQEKMHEVKVELQNAIEDLYALYFADHITKVKEKQWLNSFVGEMKEARLQNQFGSYMRDEIYNRMKKQN